MAPLIWPDFRGLVEGFFFFTVIDGRGAEYDGVEKLVVG
jgi:hypothetical protein